MGFQSSPLRDNGWTPRQCKVIAWPQFWVSFYTMTTLQATGRIPVLDPALKCKVIAWPQFWVSFYTMTTLQATSWIPVLDPAQQCKVRAWPQFWTQLYFYIQLHEWFQLQTTLSSQLEAWSVIYFCTLHRLNAGNCKCYTARLAPVSDLSIQPACFREDPSQKVCHGRQLAEELLALERLQQGDWQVSSYIISHSLSLSMLSIFMWLMLPIL